MSCETGHLNICNLVRSGVILAVGLPVALSIGGLNKSVTRALDSVSMNPSQDATYVINSNLAEPCIRWMFSDSESSLERQAMDEIDDILGGENVNYADLCNWVF